MDAASAPIVGAAASQRIIQRTINAAKVISEDPDLSPALTAHVAGPHR